MISKIKAILLSLPLVFGIAFGTQAQEGSSFGAFIAQPVGDFKSTDVRNGGFAKSGWGLAFDSKSRYNFFPENLYLYFHSTYQWNEMDTEALAAAFTEALGYKTTVTKSRYSPILTTLGPSYSIPLSDKLQLGVHGTIGIMFTNTRSFGIRVYDASGAEMFKEAVGFDNNVAFAYEVGAEFRFPLISDIMGGCVFINYTGARQSTTLTFETLNPIDSFQKLQYLNYGFKFTFPKKS